MTPRTLYKVPTSQRQGGFTLIEMLIGMAIFGILMIAFTQIFGGSLRASGQINARNELVNEGQIAQQLITSRLQSAAYLYSGTLQLTASPTTKNTVRNGADQNWIVGTDPFIAMLVPPTAVGTCQSGQTQNCFTFYAYYPMRRADLIAGVKASAPPADPNNADAWVLMEYRANIVDNINRNSATTNCAAGQGQGQLSCPPTSGTPYFGGGRSGKMLVDYVQPLGTAAPYNTMFTINTASKFVDFNLRLQQNRGGKTLTAPASTTPLTTRVYPRNWF